MTPTEQPSRGYITISSNGVKFGTMKLVLRPDIVPKTVKNFTTLLHTKYPTTPFHRLIKNFMLQGGDYTHFNGTGGASIYGDTFPDENFTLKHDRRGVLAMANKGPDTGGSQFYITFKECGFLDGKHVVFGGVDFKDEESIRVLRVLEGVETRKGDVPVKELVISKCGIYGEGEEEEKEGVTSSNGDKTKAGSSDDSSTSNSEQQEQQEEEEEEPPLIPLPTPEETATATQNLTPLERRLYNLKQKMNASRNLNTLSVLEEGKRSTLSGAKNELRRLKKSDRVERGKEWKGQLEKKGIDGKDAYMVESAGAAITKQTRKDAKVEKSKNFGWEMFNSDSQFRAYDKRLDSLPGEKKGGDGNIRNVDIYDPTNGSTSSTTTSGVTRMANELKERASVEKRRHRVDNEGLDVDYINERNHVFNKKIKRVYDKYTVEIRQNLERGTAL